MLFIRRQSRGILKNIYLFVLQQMKWTDFAAPCTEHDFYEVPWLMVTVWPTVPFLSLSFPYVHKNIAPSNVPSTPFSTPLFSLIFILYLSNVLSTIYLRRQTIRHHITPCYIVIFGFHTCDTLRKICNRTF